MYGILFWFSSRLIYFCHLLEQCWAVEILVSSSFFEQMNFEQFFFFFFWILVLVSWQAFISSLVMKLDFISQPSTNSTLPFLQDYSTCNSARFLFHNFSFHAFWSKLMVHDKWSLQWGRDSNSRPLGHESSPLPLDHGVLPNFEQLTLLHLND